jgi:putative ABC transport system permease protein
MTRLLRWALRLFPAVFRDRYGDELVDLLASKTAEVRRRRGWLGVARLWAQQSADLVRSAAAERRAMRRDPAAYRREHPVPLFEDQPLYQRLSWRPPPARGSRNGEAMNLATDLRHAARKLSRSPVFTFVSTLTLALAIGANSAIFSIVNSVILHPLPYPDSDELVAFSMDATPVGVPELPMSPAGYFHFLEKNQSFSGFGGWVTGLLALTGEDRPERLNYAAVTWTLLPTLGTSPAQGRFFTHEEDMPNAPRVAIISDGLWRRRFAADPGIIGRVLEMDGVPREVIGVMPPDFLFPSVETDVWFPLRMDPATQQFGGHGIPVIGRLREGVSIDQAKADMESLIARLSEAGYGPNWFGNVLSGDAVVRTYKSEIVGSSSRALWIIMGTVGFVLLIACTNVANLFLVRAEGSQREVAVRAALGAGRMAVIRYILCESSAVALLGGVVGLALAFGGLKVLVAIGPESIPRLNEIRIDGTVLAFTAGLSLLASLLFGLLPAFKYGNPNLVTTLKEGGRSATAGRDRHLVRSVLVVSQIALALILLVGSGLMVRSYWRLTDVDPGFSPERILTMRLSLPVATYQNAENMADFYQRLVENLEALPGVERAGATMTLPLTDEGAYLATQIEEFPVPDGGFPPAFYMRRVTPGYFEAMGIPLVRGRYFDRLDYEQRRGTSIISSNLADRYWPDQGGLGKRIAPSTAMTTTVGVVGPTRDVGLDEALAEIIYLPMLDSVGGGVQAMSLVIKTSVPPMSLLPAVRREISLMDPNLPVADIRTMDDILTASVSRRSFTMLLLSLAAGVALVLGAVGIYGVISYAVSQRTTEIGVRIALGAQRWQVRRMVLGQGLVLAGTGVGIGLVGAVGLTRLLGNLLYEVGATDPVTYSGVALFFVLVAVVASYMPAHSASQVPAVEALRYE